MNGLQRDRFAITIWIGDVMTGQQSEESFTRAAIAGLRCEQPDQGSERGFEEEWQRSLRSLQQFICELLLKNQQLRMSLEAALAQIRRDQDERSA
jgi:hypothetical protein